MIEVIIGLVCGIVISYIKSKRDIKSYINFYKDERKANKDILKSISKCLLSLSEDFKNMDDYTFQKLGRKYITDNLIKLNENLGVENDK